ncbi:hypothetical protein E6P09_08335 [Haloferax mediterranei ATCC 33500]|uniref:Uncharacterized protein n=1 Tax=Haloferax mediterranei (strain ATCC 33500 / DSM 1411 / JCM 8866 / NBRC 14739 / NCIMB 2177 / R-4) TaxID=523841 RepID=M0J5T9_HALMT|nr:hypothetical protein C439_05180 [Haloferax mediterranei ATCC 33500]QCQ75270.1 hypothetical protein E6P09_08335 [Haloferax mediterranei ATCC 33500]
MLGQQFPDRHAAGEAAELVSEYRSVLRRYDPGVPYYDPLVHELSERPMQPLATEPEDNHTRYRAFCHDVSGSLFEALAETGHRVVETAVMETYLTLAEVVEDHDDFCLTLLWSMMSELDVRLSPSEQNTIVETAAELFSPTTTPNPVGSTLRTLEAVAFIDGYSLRPICDPESGCSDGHTPKNAIRTWELTFGDYALAERTGRIPTLPIAVDLLRRTPERAVRFIDGEALSDGRWRVRLQTIPDGESRGLVSVEAVENRWLNDS